MKKIFESEDIKARIVYHKYRATPVKTLVISFSNRRRALSSRDGFKEVKVVCNNYNPPSLWEHIVHEWKTHQEELMRNLSLSDEETFILVTAADMDNLSFKKEVFDGLEVYAFVTADVETNAMRIGVDRGTSLERDGKFETIGTINIIVLTNAYLSDGAMVRSVITATEAKVIALQDLNIRSSYNPSHQATGTGTDNMIVVSGDAKGERINYVGGHSKMGEMMAKAVTSATKEAILYSKGYKRGDINYIQKNVYHDKENGRKEPKDRGEMSLPDRLHC